MELAGRRLGSYHILEQIGHGQLGSVYRAYEPALDRYVAIRVLGPNPEIDDLAIERIMAQARAVAALHHANILPVFHVGQEGDVRYIATEYCQDDTLAELLERGGSLPLARVVPIAEQLAAALDHAHHKGVVHADVKPANIYVTGERAVLSDFGLSRAAGASEGGHAAGASPYMAPEQARGEEFDYRADLYALGAVTYEMLTGLRPPPHDTRPTPPASDVILLGPALRSGLPRPVERVLEQALAPSPGDRWPSGAAMAAALRHVLAARQGWLKEQPLTLAAQPIYREGTAEPVAPITPGVPLEPLAPVRGRRRWHGVPLFWVGLAVLVLAGMLLLGLIVGRGGRGGAARTPSPTPTSPATATEWVPLLPRVTATLRIQPAPTSTSTPGSAMPGLRPGSSPLPSLSATPTTPEPPASGNPFTSPLSSPTGTQP